MNDATGNTTRDTTDRATRHDVVSVNDAAVALGITPDSVRARLRRGSLAGEKIGPIWYVYGSSLGNSQVTDDRATRHDTPRDVTRQRDSDRDELLEELRADKRYLQEQLDRALRQLESERQRSDVLQALGTSTTPDPATISPGSPQANETGPPGIRAWARRLWRS